MKSTIYHLHAISGLHVGTGQGIGVIDMPIARERASNLPLVPGSGIKGVLRDECRLDKPKKDASEADKAAYNDYLALFGSEAKDNNASEYAGALAVGDAHLLCLPIRSWKGTFAWVTCPMILRRYQRDTKCGDSIPEPTETGCLHTVYTDKAGKEIKTLVEGDKVYLEDLDLLVQEGANDWAEAIANNAFEDDGWKKLFKERFLIVPDNTFDFLSETATEIRARIRIKEDTRTVQNGALWYEEYLPAETLLWGVVASDNARNGSKKEADALLDILSKVDKRLQIGGNATIGAGQVRWILGSSQVEEGGE